jgi:kumamolisin
MQRHPVAGSERKPLAGAKRTGPAQPDERLEVSVVLRQSATAALQDRIERLNKGDTSLAPMTREAFAASHGAAKADIAAVERFAAQHHLTVVSSSAPRRTVVLAGTVANFQDAFGVTLGNYEHAEGSYRGREGVITLPPELKDIVQAVMGLDNRPQARAHFRGLRRAATPAAAPVSYTPTMIASIYGFPEGTGAGQTIGIIELGGGTRAADLKTYFESLGMAPPSLVSVSVDHGRNHASGGANGPDGEVMLDIEVAGAVAPGAKLVAYFSPNTDAGFLDAVTTAIHDTTHKPSVISISWGGPESSWTAQAITAFDQAFQDAAALGVTVCVAAGDNGSGDGVTDGANHVDFPASSPHVLACGGTSLQASGNAISSETVWNDGANGGAGGGGISTAFTTVPTWQSGLSAALTAGGSVALTGRGVPDVAGDADPETGYQVRVDGSNTVIGGTSAVAPLWAGLIARLNASRGTPLGFVNPLLYGAPAAFNDIVSGNNGAYAAAKGWDACTGLGSPIGAALAKLLANNGNPNIKESSFMANKKADPAKTGAIQEKAVMVRDKPAEPGKVKGEAVMVRDEPAAPGKLKDKAVTVRDEPAKPATHKEKA